jgi:DNA-binding MarR family transcriptional regulator
MQLKDYAELLNISTSTLSHNISKLEDMDVIKRVKEDGKKSVNLKLKSKGQLYAIEIREFMDRYFEQISIQQCKELS